MKVIIKKVKGLFLFYLALFGYFVLDKNINIYHRRPDNRITRKAENYFKKYKLPQKIIDFFNLVFTKYRNEIGEQALGYFSILYDYSKKTKEIKKILKEEKELEYSLYKILSNQLLDCLSAFEKFLQENPSLIYYLDQYVDKDIKRKEKFLIKIKEIIKEDLNFFGINKIHFKKIIITPLNYFPFQAASIVYLFGDFIIIVSSEKFHPEVIEHEFLHGIINPLVKKIIRKNPSLIKSILKLSPPFKKTFYKNNPEIILREALIYSYIDFKNKKLLTYDQFLKKLPFKNNNQFKKCLQHSNFKKKCELLKIKSFQDFLKKSKKYYSLFIKNNLAERCYSLYRYYSKEKTENPKLKFKIWLNKNINRLVRE